MTVAVDTSAVIAVLLAEPGHELIEQTLIDDEPIMSAPTRVELGIVIEARNGAAGTQLLEDLLERVGMVVEPIDSALAAEAVSGWRRFGKGRHPAGLNFGDTFSYALAVQRGLPLLFVGDDFAQTDVQSAL